MRAPHPLPVEPAALELWFDDEPLGVRINLETASLGEAMPALLAGIGEQLPADHQSIRDVAAKPVEELILKSIPNSNATAISHGPIAMKFLAARTKLWLPQ